jgi:glycine/sarcosine N-methyltransferase
MHIEDMNQDDARKQDPEAIFRSPKWYDQSINWQARIDREIPVLTDVFGPPGQGGVIDAGCGTGRQACALAAAGYRVTGADISDEMLEMAAAHAKKVEADVRFVQSSYASLHEQLGGGFDGLYCLGNALAASGEKEEVRRAIHQFASCLRPGGVLFVQVLNFLPMRRDQPCVRGPRVSRVDDREYISVRQFHFEADRLQVTNITIYNDGAWRQRAHGGSLYPIGLDELRSLCDESGLSIEHEWGSYKREAFDIDNSVDLIIVARRAP